MSNRSPQVPSQHRVPIQGSQNTDPKPQGLCTGCALCLEYSTLTCSPPLPVRLLRILQAQVSSLLCFLIPPTRISCFLSLGRKELRIQCLPSTKPVCLPLALPETSLINRSVGMCLNFPGSMRTNEVSGSGAAQRKHLKVCSFFFFPRSNFPQTLKTLHSFLLVT